MLFVNSAFERLFDADAGGLAGRDFWATFPTLQDTADGEGLRATMSDGIPRRYRAHAHKSHPSRWYDVRATRVPGGGLAIQYRDISDMVSAERELTERNEENESLRDVAGALAEEADLGALLRLICAQAAAQSRADGATVIEVSGDEGIAVAATGAIEWLRGYRFPLAGSLSERALAERSTVRVAERSEGYQGAWADMVRERGIGPFLLAPLLAHAETLGVLTVVRRHGMAPFTEREAQRIRSVADQAALAVWKTRLFDQAQEANRAKSDFMARMSHELRTPLTALAGYEELMADGILGPLSDDQRGALERMRWSTRLLTTIVEEILTFSRLEAGEVTVCPRETTAEEILQGVAAVLEPLASARDLALGVTLPSAPLPFVTDPDIARRVLVNLGANAVKFTDRGAVELSAGADEGEVQLAVRDTGIGIAAEDLKRLFQPFTQIDGGVTRRHGGTGLGLYTAGRLARLLGGRIDVHSELGAGSEFTVFIPRR
ncbi:MAG: GAF domain-containing sensor histidine kinase [Gemmatimonadota bacterium]|nr:GAF domain-containing sensor histidine kinase [Gemmatimonadota bacterium]